MRVLLNTPQITVRCDDDALVVTMVRSRLELPRERAPLRKFYDQLLSAFDGLHRPTFALIVDGRAAVGRNDETFEAVQAEYAQRLFGGYREVLALVATTAGRLQVARYGASEDRRCAEMFSTIEEAFAYVAIDNRSKHG